MDSSAELFLADDRLIGTMAVGEGLITQTQLDRLTEQQAVLYAHGEDVRLTQLMLREGILDAAGLAHLESAGGRLGNYHLLGKLGKGGMGSVYRAVRVSDHQEVAVKLLGRRRSQNKKFLKRFVQEAKILARVQHPNVVRSLEFSNDRGFYFLAMEYIDGLTLVDRIEDLHQLEEAEVLRIGRAVALGLQAAWEADLVHRDVKPENILLGKQGAVKISDFGLAKDPTGGLKTTAGITFGTPHYMSPEQVQGSDDLDCRSDVYSLGGTLYHALAGQFPYDADSDVDIMLMHLESKPLPLRELNPLVSRPTASLIERMMERDRADRPATPQEVVEEIDEIVAGTWTPRQKRLSRRIMRATADTGRDLSGRLRLASETVSHSPRAKRMVTIAATLAVIAFLIQLVAFILLKWR